MVHSTQYSIRVNDRNVLCCFLLLNLKFKTFSAALPASARCSLALEGVRHL